MLASEQDQAVDRQEDGGGQGLGEERAKRVLEEQTGDAHGDGRRDNQPGQALVR
jgi:hypothetical protein